MSIAWGTLKGYIREAILKDVPQVVADETLQTEQFSDNQLLIAARWACSALSMHTAQQATRRYNCDGQSYIFDMPDDIVDNIEKAGLVIYDDGSMLNYLAPVRLLPSVQWPKAVLAADQGGLQGYWQWPFDRLTLSFVPAAGAALEVRYFKSWNAPANDADILEFPRQFEQAFAYYVGASTFDPLGAQASSIRQWNRRQDSGTPEDNPLHRQSEFFLKQAERVLRGIGAQDRETFYTHDPRDLGFQR